MATTRLSRTFSQTATSTKKGTFSCWFKRGTLGGEHDIIASPNGGDGGGNRSFIRIDNNNQIDFRINNSSNTNVPNMLFTDTNAWYHIVLAIDLTQAGGSDRLKFYVNGNLITSYSSQNYPSGSLNISWGQNNVVTDIGYDTTDGGAGYFDGSMSHIHWTDGTQYAPTEFGETDSTTGEWKIKTDVSVTYGTNGFFILKDGNSVTDQSGNSNNFTVAAGTLTKTEDCPSNVFATMNPLGTYDGTLENGNTRVRTNQTNYRYIASTLGVDKGKYYWECKLQEISNYMLSGITDQPSFPASGVVMLGNGTYDCAVYIGDQSANGGNGHLYHSSTSNNNNTNTPGSFMAAFAQGDILTFALDLDSATKKLYIGANGQWANGSGATNQTFGNSTGVSIVIPQNTNTGHYFPACGDYSGDSGHWEYNFGNGYFGTTAVSSAGSNASGIGIFEHDVPAGYTALSTKGINSF